MQPERWRRECSQPIVDLPLALLSVSDSKRGRRLISAIRAWTSMAWQARVWVDATVLSTMAVGVGFCRGRSRERGVGTEAPIGPSRRHHEKGRDRFHCAGGREDRPATNIGAPDRGLGGGHE